MSRKSIIKVVSDLATHQELEYAQALTAARELFDLLIRGKALAMLPILDSYPEQNSLVLMQLLISGYNDIIRSQEQARDLSEVHQHRVRILKAFLPAHKP